MERRDIKRLDVELHDVELHDVERRGLNIRTVIAMVMVVSNMAAPRWISPWQAVACRIGMLIALG